MDASCDAPLGESLTEPVGIIAFVAEEFLGLRQGRQYQRRAFVVAHLAFAEQHDQRSSVAIAHGVQFRVQAAFRAPDTSGTSPFFRRLAAVRWAFIWVASIISRRGLPALRVSSAKILLNTPRRLQRTNRLYTVLCGPYSRGASRHRNPFLMTKTIPLITRRSSTLGTPCDSGKNGSIRRICASESRNKSVMATPPRAAIESTDHLIRKIFNGS